MFHIHPVLTHHQYVSKLISLNSAVAGDEIPPSDGFSWAVHFFAFLMLLLLKYLEICAEF